MSTDTMLGKKDRGHVIDWKRVADSYRDDMCALILAGNEMRRSAVSARAVKRWDAAVKAATAAEAPICTLSSSDSALGEKR